MLQQAAEICGSNDSALFAYRSSIRGAMKYECVSQCKYKEQLMHTVYTDPSTGVIMQQPVCVAKCPSSTYNALNPWLSSAPYSEMQMQKLQSGNYNVPFVPTVSNTCKCYAQKSPFILQTQPLLRKKSRQRFFAPYSVPICW